MLGKLILVVGPSGVGKDTLLDGARDVLADDPRFHFVRRDITRPAQAGGEDHNPVTIEAFQSALQADAYGLHWGAHDLLYGLPKSELRSLETGNSVVANGSRSVLDKARQCFDRLAIISITTDLENLRDRLLARGRETEADIARRIERAGAFDVKGADVSHFENDTSIADGIARFVELLVRLDGRILDR